MEKLGRYDVLARLAVGGMAEIFLGRITGPSGFERPVVLKRVLPHLALTPSFIDMFLDEAEITAGIRHPNVTQVHELGTDGEELFLAMEYLEGESVAGLLRRLHSREQSLPAPLAAFIVADACAGLHAAHELLGPDGKPRGLVHRDVSPQNIFVTYDGVVKILDFGIAKAADRITHTEAGNIKGKFAYMSPEQSRGEPLDRRSDIFALGIVLFELLTGHHLFKRDNDSRTLQALWQDEVAAPSALVACSAAIERVCLQCLERQPADRPATALAVRDQLLRAIARLDEESFPHGPGPALAVRMCELFDDRKLDKRHMLERAGAVTKLADVPAAEVDLDVALPAVVVPKAVHPGAPLGTTEEPAPEEPAPEEPATGDPTTEGRAAAESVATAEPTLTTTSARRRAMMASAVAAALIGGYVVSTRSVPSATSVAVATTRVAARAPQEAVVVSVRVVTSPAGAEVSVDGVHKGRTPILVALPASSLTKAFEVGLDGYETVREQVRPVRDQLLRVALRKTASGPYPGPPSASVPPSPRRPTRRTAPAPASKPAPTPPPIDAPTPTPPAAPASQPDPWRKW